jgi:predicted O-linked N-acetylglucosamine transferase (SPINDLY family)
LRPAAVQIQYLGFPGTSGADWHDYAIVDQTVISPDERDYWSERLVFMPRSFFVTDRDQPISAVGATRADFGLPDSGIVFCSFNQHFKIDSVVFGAWMQILANVPDSVLWLPGSAHSEDNLRRAVVQAGIASERLIFAGRTLDKAQHLERLALAEIALDTLNYNGHTTTSDALWAGVPVIAMMGKHFASRVSASLLKAVELDELIVRDVDEYVALAVNLAQSPSERARLRAHLASARLGAPLFDTDRTVADLERAYEQIWKRFKSGGPAGDIYL